MFFATKRLADLMYLFVALGFVIQQNFSVLVWGLLSIVACYGLLIHMQGTENNCFNTPRYWYIWHLSIFFFRLGRGVTAGYFFIMAVLGCMILYNIGENSQKLYTYKFVENRIGLQPGSLFRLMDFLIILVLGCIVGISAIVLDRRKTAASNSTGLLS